MRQRTVAVPSGLSTTYLSTVQCSDDPEGFCRKPTTSQLFASLLRKEALATEASAKGVPVTVDSLKVQDA